MERFRYPLGIQITLPEEYKTDREFEVLLRLLREKGFSDVELNIADPFKVPLEDVTTFLERFGLRMSMFASGLTAKNQGLSLSHEAAAERQRGVNFLLKMIGILRGQGIGIIIGFLKGPKCGDSAAAIERFIESIGEAAPAAEEAEVPLLVEATNRYESSVANSLAEAAQIVKHSGSRMIKILPDTFHMNIEEADVFGALGNCRDFYNSIHLSDNNRFLPGFGGIDFREMIRFLDALGYRGRLALEGNPRSGFPSDLEKTMNYLAPILASENDGSEPEKNSISDRRKI